MSRFAMDSTDLGPVQTRWLVLRSASSPETCLVVWTLCCLQTTLLVSWLTGSLPHGQLYHVWLLVPLEPASWWRVVEMQSWCLSGHGKGKWRKFIWYQCLLTRAILLSSISISPLPNTPTEQSSWVNPMAEQEVCMGRYLKSTQRTECYSLESKGVLY